MKHTHYIAFIETGPNNYSAFFPDMPGCVSAGDTLDETIANAAEALRGHVDLMIDDGDPIPPPRSIEVLRGDPELAEDFTRLVIAAVPLSMVEAAEAA